MDASEPNVRDCTDLEYRKALCGPTALGSSTEFFNRKVSIWRVFGTTGKLKVKATFMLLYLNYRPTVTVLKFRNILPFKF
jgi:hypothetical protein